MLFVRAIIQAASQVGSKTMQHKNVRARWAGLSISISDDFLKFSRTVSFYRVHKSSNLLAETL